MNPQDELETQNRGPLFATQGDETELQEPINPFDTTAESQELETLQNEISQAEQSLEENVAKDIAGQITPELEELFFSDKEAFLKQIFILQNNYLETHLKSKQAKAQRLQTNINVKKTNQAIADAAEAFENETGLDTEELMQMYSQMPADLQNQLASLQPLEFFYALADIYNQIQGGDEQQESNEESTQNPQDSQEAPQGMPQQLKGIPRTQNGASGYYENEPMPMDRM